MLGLEIITERKVFNETSENYLSCVLLLFPFLNYFESIEFGEMVFSSKTRNVEQNLEGEAKNIGKKW